MPKLSLAPTYYMGIDPGKSSGSAHILSADGKPLQGVPGKLEGVIFDRSTEHEIGEWFKDIVKFCDGNLKAALERVHSMPKQSAQSGFSFGQNYGLLRGLLIAHQIPFVEPTPQGWQKKLCCRTGGNKNISKGKAHELWPQFTKQITHHVADSLLIGEWLRLTDQGK